MPNANEFEVQGQITDIQFAFTRAGKKYGRVKVKGILTHMWVVVFSPAQVTKLLTAHKGDTVIAKGMGRHTGGSIRARGNTELKARLFRIKEDAVARAAFNHVEPTQLSLI